MEVNGYRTTWMVCLGYFVGVCVGAFLEHVAPFGSHFVP